MTEHATIAMPTAASSLPQRRYNPGAPLCFVHVAKSAGTSVRLMMENAFPGDRTYPAASRYIEAPYSRPAAAREAGDDFAQFVALSAHAGAEISGLLASDANLFTWLREPEDRVVSAFFFFVIQERQSRYSPSIERLDAGERVESVFLDWLNTPDTDHQSQMGQLVYGMSSNRPDWRETHPGVDLMEAATDALRRCFHIGIMEDHERSLDALCAITSILPPALKQRRNPGTSRPAGVNFTPAEQAKFDQILAPDRAFYALAREVYYRQMAELAERALAEPALALIGNREGLRRHILDGAAGRTPVLTRWAAWDPILGENLDSREQLGTHGNAAGRWRWTGNHRDTSLHFRLPRRTAFDLCITLAPATPSGHAEQTSFKLSGEPVPLQVRQGPDGRTELVATIPASLADRLPDLAELHLHTGLMLDESTLVPYAGTRKLGLAIAEISATPVSPLLMLRRRVGGSRVAQWTRRFLRRLRKS